MRVSAAVAVAALVLLAGGQTVAAQDFPFMNVVDTMDGSFNQVGAAGINNTGTVVFVGDRDGVGEGLFAAAPGSPAITLADTSGMIADFGAAFPSVNDSGSVAFSADLDDGSTAVLATTTSGGAVTTVTETGRGFTGPRVNAGGTVVFAASRDDGSGIFTRSISGGPTSTVADTDGPYQSFRSAFPPINDAGTVSFVAETDSGDVGVFAVAGGTTHTVASQSGDEFSAIGFDTSINDTGSVAFRAATTEPSGGPIPRGVEHLYVRNLAGGPTLSIADTAGPLSQISLSGFTINESGMVVFQATDDAGADGIYVGNGLAPPQKVIAQGDSLFGSTATWLTYLHTGFNDRGEVAFFYNLESGASGIAIATIPEPTSAVAIAAAGLLLLRRRHVG